MRIQSHDYAELANDSYADRAVGMRPPAQREPVTLGGVDYRILEHVDSKKTGYQGTLYQRVDGGEIVVAHRGTEQIWKDGVVTDGSMVLSRINPQANEAVELTRRAIAFAMQEGMQPGKGSKDRLVPLGEESQHWLETYLARSRPALVGKRSVPAG